MFEGVIQHLVDLPGWSHLGLICFTEIDNKGILKEKLPNLTEEELKVCDPEMTVSAKTVMVNVLVYSDERRTRGSFMPLAPLSEAE